MVKNYTKYTELTGLYDALMEKYLPSIPVTLTVCHNATVLRHFSTQNIEMEAILAASDVDGQYVLYVAENLGRVDVIACHEFAHLMQMIRGDLAVKLPERTFVWKGRIYPSSVPYGDRPWEQEAFRLQTKYHKDFKIFRNEK